MSRMLFTNMNSGGKTGNNPFEGSEEMETEHVSRSEQLAALIDIRDVKIDKSLPIEERVRSYVRQIKNPYLFKVGNTIVRVSYADTDRTINDNFANMIAAM